MKRCLTIFAVIILMVFAAQPAYALKVIVATIAMGEVQVIGIQAQKKAKIYWEGVEISNSNNFGQFHFSTTVLPIDCVGQLSDGVSTIDVVIFGCTTEQMVGGGVPATGQTISYATGDDGDLQEGVPLPQPRFTDNGDGTVTDNLTELIWLKNANCAGVTRDWSQALEDVANLNSNGTMNGNDCGDTSNAGNHQTDWRLPNVKELHSLVDYGQHGPALSAAHPFINFLATSYRSSTTAAADSNFALGVEFWNGCVSWGGKAAGSFAQVTAVRGGL